MVLQNVAPVRLFDLKLELNLGKFCDLYYEGVATVTLLAVGIGIAYY